MKRKICFSLGPTAPAGPRGRGKDALGAHKDGGDSDTLHHDDDAGGVSSHPSRFGGISFSFRTPLSSTDTPFVAPSPSMSSPTTSLPLTPTSRVNPYAEESTNDNDDVDELSSQVERLKSLGNDSAERGEYDAALGLWSRAIGMCSDNSELALLYELKAQALLATNRYFDAVKAATSSSAFDPEWPESKVTLARALFNYGELQMCISAFEEAISSGCEDQTSVNMELDEAKSLLVQQEQLELDPKVHVIRGVVVKEAEESIS